MGGPVEGGLEIGSAHKFECKQTEGGKIMKSIRNGGAIFFS